MAAIRKQCRLNKNTFLIDYGLFGILGGGAVYLVEGGEKRCLIDAGTHKEASRIYKVLKELGAFPLDIIILTHSHWDHCQGVSFWRDKATENNRDIEIMASENAIPLLEDQSWNDVHGQKNLKSIKDVKPIKEGDIVDLGDLSLKIFDVPGHCKDDIAVLDEANKNLFVGDAIGVKTGDQMYIPPFQPPFWDKDAFYQSVNKIREIDYDGLCLAHFGYIYEDEAKDYLDEAVATYELWWRLFEENVEKLDDRAYMTNLIYKETNMVYPDIPILSPKLKVLYGLMSGAKKIVGKKPPHMGEILLTEIIGLLVQGFRIYKEK